MGAKNDKTNVMRLLDKAGIEYKVHNFNNEDIPSGSQAADAPVLGLYLSGYVLPSGLRGWTLVRGDGLSLGGAKGDGTQLKNHYP